MPVLSMFCSLCLCTVILAFTSTVVVQRVSASLSPQSIALLDQSPFCFDLLSSPHLQRIIAGTDESGNAADISDPLDLQTVEVRMQRHWSIEVGFHRRIVTQFALKRKQPHQLRGSKQQVESLDNCAVMFIDHLPSGLYSDSFEAQREQLSLPHQHVCSPHSTEVELPRHLSNPMTVLTVLENVTLHRSDVDRPTKCEASVPIHLRYARPQRSVAHAHVSLPPPQSLHISCPLRDSHPSTAHTRRWHRVNIQSTKSLQNQTEPDQTLRALMPLAQLQDGQLRFDSHHTVIGHRFASLRHAHRAGPPELQD